MFRLRVNRLGAIGRPVASTLVSPFYSYKFIELFLFINPYISFIYFLYILYLVYIYIYIYIHFSSNGYRQEVQTFHFMSDRGFC